jgi:hypothetical protein
MSNKPPLKYSKDNFMKDTKALGIALLQAATLNKTPLELTYVRKKLQTRYSQTFLNFLHDLASQNVNPIQLMQRASHTSASKS